MAPPTTSLARSTHADRFLHAKVWTERNGMDLSVLSMLARSGKDPWAETARLARLPRAAATGSLTATIAGLPGSGRSQAQAREVALRLVPLLPGRAGTPSAGRPAGGAPQGRAAAVLMFGGTLAAALMFGLLLAATLRSASGTDQPGAAVPSGRAAPHADGPAS